ncbi:MAG: hypothetical protein SFU98_01220 [Leptospiraceae bacterium]|nr:hypothetical protein [Leptospiraceae bacterium]
MGQTIIKLIKLFFLLSFISCTLLQKKVTINPGVFDYAVISSNYFSKPNQKPFPLTVQSGNNLYNSTTGNGAFLFYTTDHDGNYNISFRDLRSSVVVPVTNHPAPEYKPAISPDGRFLAFVSEEHDSEGDIVLLEMEPEIWVKEFLKGNKFISTDFEFITNPKYENLKQKDHFKDTDPVFTPDGKKIIFVSERLSQGIPNLVSYDLKSKKFSTLTEKGAASPNVSMDGKFIVYISYKDHPLGEIYKIDLTNNSEERITKDEFLDLSPSLSRDSRTLYFTSIRKDSNKNGALDTNDTSSIFSLDLNSKKENRLTSGSASAFDSHYSNFNYGSIIYSATYNNSINIYFMPLSGSIARKNTIEEQYDFALSYKKNKDPDTFLLALDSVKQFFESDPMYEIYSDLVEDEKLGVLERTKKFLELNQRMDFILTEKEKHFRTALVLLRKSKMNKKKDLKSIESLLKEIETEPKKNEQVIGSIIHLLGSEYEKEGKIEKAVELYHNLINDYPNYYKKSSVTRRLGLLAFNEKETRIPEIFFSLASDEKLNLSEKSLLLNSIEENVKRDKNFKQKLEHTDAIIQTNNLKERSKSFFDLMTYIKAQALYEEKKFQESNSLLDTILAPIPKESETCAFDPSTCVLEKLCKDDPTCLKSHLLKFKNFEGLGKIICAQNEGCSLTELRVFLENYNPNLGVEMDKTEMEKSFRHFENQAREYESRGNLKEAAFNYFYNVENMRILKTKDLHVDTLYKDYAVYYQRKMVDSILNYAKQQADERRNNLLTKLNILGKDKLDVLGKLNSILTTILESTKITDSLKSVFGDLRDLRDAEILGKTGEPDDILQFIEKFHFEEYRPRARPVLYLASLYGYAYYLINKNVIFDVYYRENKEMTVARKEKILEDFKKAEYELKWIIFADPEYSDAYQLLGWLYQYIDISKTLNSVDQTPDGVLFANSYEKFFSKRHFEENIDLYNQILAFLGNIPNKKILSDLNLNLANNYLLLNKYPNANQHFKEVEKNKKFINPIIHFENYKREAVFHFNFGRSLLFQGKYLEAADNFKKATEIYYKNEYYSGLNQKEKNNNEYPTLYKLTLTNALTGLTYMEGGYYREAIFYFKKAYSENFQDNFISNLSIFNSIAICYMKLNDFKSSREYTNKVKKLFAEEKSPEINYSLQDILIWNNVLPLETRTLGVAKFSGSFPKEYHFILALGVERESYERQLEFDKADVVINLRKEFIEKNKINKLEVGKRILYLDNSTSGNNHYYQEDFPKSRKIFSEFLSDAKERNKWLVLKKIIYNDFALIEEAKKSKPLETLEANMKLLNSFKKEEVAKCVESTDKKSNTTTMELEIFCEKKFYKEYLDYHPILGSHYYYLGNLTKNSSIQNSLYYLGLAEKLFSEPSYIPKEEIGLGGDPYPRIERLVLKINEIRTLLEIGDRDKILGAIREGEYFANEFSAKKEWFEIKILEIENAIQEKNLSRAKEIFTDIRKDIRDEYALILNSKFQSIEKFYLLGEKCLVLQKNYDELLEIREEKRNLILFKNFFQNTFSFDNELFQKKYTEVKEKLDKYLELYLYIRKSVNEKKPIANLKLEQNKQQITVKNALLELKKYDKNKSIFLLPDKQESIEVLKEQDIAFQCISTNNVWLVWKYQFKTKRTRNVFNSKDELISYLTKLSLDGKNIILIPDENTFQLPFKKEIFKNAKTFRFAFADFQVYPNSRSEILNLENIARVADKKEISLISKEDNYFVGERLNQHIYNTDIVYGSISKVRKANIFGESLDGSLSLKQLFQKNHNINTVVFENDLEKPFEYDVIYYTSLVLNLSLVPAVIFPEKKDFQSGTDSETNRKELIRISEKEDSYNIGSNKFYYRGTYFSDLSKDLFQVALHAEKENDYETAISKINLATASMDENKSKEEKLNIDIAEARIKAKFYSLDKKFFFFDELLKKHNSNSEAKILVFESLLKYCYIYLEVNECESYYTDYKKFVNEQKNPIQSLRLLAQGKYSEVDLDDLEKLKPSPSEDLFLHEYDLAILYKKQFFLAKANEKAEHLLKVAGSPIEKRKIETLNREIQVLIHLTGIGPKKNLDKSTDIYSCVISKDWVNFDKWISEIEKDEIEDVIKSFRKKLFITWKKLETGEDYNPNYLKSELNSSGETYYSQLEDKDRILIYYILSKSVVNQLDSEINDLFEELIDKKSKIKKNLVGYFVTSFAETLFSRGDLKKSKFYAEKFLSDFSQALGNKELDSRIYFLQYKINLLSNNDNSENSSIENQFYSHFQTAKSKKIPELYLFYNQVLKLNSNEKFSSKMKRELGDLIYYLQFRAYEEGNAEFFLDLVFYRDKFNSFNERFYSKTIYIKDLPELKEISKSILNTLPKDQVFIGVGNLGLETHYIVLENKSAKGEEEPLFKDNRIIRNEVYNYYRLVAETGNALLKKESLENKLRKGIRLDKYKNKITYLYLSSYLFKIPIEYRESDSFFHVQNPESLVKNQPKKLNDYFNKDYQVIYSKFGKSEFPTLEKLLELETRVKGNGKSKVYLIGEKLHLKDLELILLGNEPLVTKKVQTQDGVWVIINSSLYETSFFKDDINNAIYYLGFRFHGPGIFTIGPTLGETHHIFFTSELVKNGVFQNVRARYLNAHKKLKFEYSSEIYWNSYKLYTNTYLYD